MKPARILFTSLIDYAGLFPPAKLPMVEAVKRYGAHRTGDDAWMLGRFIVPVSRLTEFEQVAGEFLPHEGDDPWPISALIGDNLDSDIDRVFAFNQAHAEDPVAGLAVVDAIEMRADGPRSVDRSMGVIPEQLTPYFEIPHDSDLRGLITALAGTDARAKLRCGGVTVDLFPTPEHIAEFLTLCHAADVPFKATAGLHHPVRSEHALTYEADAPRGLMHGFINVFLASAFVRRASMTRDDAAAMLREDDPRSFRFGEETVSWRQYAVTSALLASVRESFAIGFGSCSFDEPVADLRALALLG